VHGTYYEERDGRLVRIVDRTGQVHAELSWRRGATELPGALDPAEIAGATEPPGPLDPAEIAGASGSPGARDPADLADSARQPQLVRLAVAGAAVDGAVIAHPLLGAAHAVGDTAMSALVWARPTEIPAIAEPGRLPLGAGAAILNTIAVLARRAGVASLRYAGPYPTPALWRTLARSFRCDASEAAFTAGALERALRVARDPIAVDFIPAPHERIAIAGGFVELRDAVERVVIDGIAYEPAYEPAYKPAYEPASKPGGSPARLVAGDPRGDDRDTAARAGHPRDPDLGAQRHCEIWFGDAPYARVATVAPDGALLAGPHAIPACTSPVLGRAFPQALRLAIAELVAGAVAAPLGPAARELCAGLPLCWADLGARAAGEHSDGFAVHAALWDRIAPLGLGRLALALAEALAPVVTAAVVARAQPGASRATSEPAA
jgi:hypothetical protein